jgi:hypothetical protein
MPNILLSKEKTETVVSPSTKPERKSVSSLGTVPLQLGTHRNTCKMPMKYD